MLPLTFQLGSFVFLLMIWVCIRRFHAVAVLGVPVFGLLAWLAIAGLSGVSEETPWFFYTQLFGVWLLGYAALILAYVTLNRWGEPYHGEGAMAAGIPLLWSPIVLLPCLVIKAVWWMIVT